jgi:drug/metabolite transporter (DMT)-like permease
VPRHLLFPFVLMLVQATVFGSTFSINKLAATAGVPPFTYSFWQSLGSAALLAIVVHVRGWFVSLSSLKGELQLCCHPAIARSCQ